MIQPFTLLTDFDISLFKAGKHTRLYEKMGAHEVELNGQKGIYFAVYAPSAKAVQVVGDFNHWNGENYHLNVRWDSSGIWEGFIPNISQYTLYKYRIFSNIDDKSRDKADPFGFFNEVPPQTASLVWTENYDWKDKKWMKSRHEKNGHQSPISIYEVHLGSWKKKKDSHESLSYVEMADELVEYVKKMGFTHVEFMPVMEHPFYPSWGYLSTGYFSPSSRYGNPSELKILIDQLHQNDIAVLLDWVPAHFPSDDFALADFDGSCLYEHPDRSKGFHPDWNSLIFNFERNEIRSFLLSSAHFWMDQFHADGLRVDAVSSMIYLDYSRNDGEWEPNIHGSNENLEAISFLQELNTSIYRDFDGIQMIAEESTAFHGVTKPVHEGGLGFGIKWMMGWMNDTIDYFSKEPIYRSFHQNDITFSLTYAFTENFLLPLSHDEVVHGKGSMLAKMPGDEWQKIANLRLLYSYMFMHPGANLLFMGCEFGQATEWNVNQALDWDVTKNPLHKGLQKLIQDLNKLIKKEPAIYENQFSPEGFEWVDYADNNNAVISFLRKSDDEEILVICNFTPQVLHDYSIGVDNKKSWSEIFNSDYKKYSGSGIRNKKKLIPKKTPLHNKSYSINISLPPLGVSVLKQK